MVSLLGVVGVSGEAPAAVSLTSTCPVVSLGGLIAGDDAGPGAQAATTTLSYPVGLAVAQSDGTMYVSERNWDTPTNQGRVRRIAPDGSITDLPRGPANERLGRLAINLAGTVLFMATRSTAGGERVYSLDLSAPTPAWTLYAGGGTDLLGNGVAATSARFISIEDIGVSPTTGLLYIAAIVLHPGPPPVNVGIIREVDGAGTIRTVAGGVTSTAATRLEGIPANTAYVEFSPVTLAFDGAGVISLGALRRVRRIVPAATSNPYGDGLIITFAGTNTADDVSGDGGAAATAHLGAINGLALDSAGVLYVGGPENHGLRRIDAAGATIDTVVSETGSAVSDAGIAGFADGPGDTARLAFSEQIAAFSGDVFVVDSRNNRIRRVTPGATAALTIVATVAGRGPNMVDESGPALTRRTGLLDGIATDVNGSVYLADRTAYRVWRRDPDGMMTAVAGNGTYRGLQGALPGGAATSNALSVVRDVATSEDAQTLYILERTRVLAVDVATGVLSVVAGTGAIGQADNVSGPLATLDSGTAGSLTVGGGSLFATTTAGTIRRISLATGAVDTPITGLASNAVSVDADVAGNVFLGMTNHQILYWPGSGVPVVIAGNGVSGNTGSGGPASAAQVGSPRGLALLDRPGNDDVLYFADALRRVRSITAGPGSGAARWSGGTIDLVAGNPSNTPLGPGDWGDGRDLTADKTATRFNTIRDMDLGPDGRLFIDDSNFDANPSLSDATNTGPHMLRVLTDTGCAEASVGGPATVDTATSGPVPLRDLPLGQIAFDTAGIAATPMRAVPMRASELDSTPMRASPMRAVPMRAVPMRASGLANTPMRASSLSAFPLDPEKFPGGWPERLEGTPYDGVLPQNIRFSDLLDDPATPTDETSAALDKAPQITLEDINLAASPMRAVSIASIALGATPMRAVPMRASLIGATDAQRFQAWCDLLTDPTIPEISQLGYTCASLGLTPDSPLLALDIASVPMRAVPMRAVPMRAVDISASPMRAVPMRASGIAVSGITTALDDPDVRSSPMRAVPMRAVAVDSAPMRAVPLSAIPMRASDARPSPMRAVQLSLLGANAAIVATCYPACQTLGEAADLNAISPSATIGDLIPALDAVLSTTGAVPTLGDLRFGNTPLAGLDKDGDNVITAADEINLGDIIPFLPEEPFISLADVLVGFIGTQDLPWEDISLDAMGVTSLATGTTAVLPFSFRLFPGQSATVPLSVALPAGWRYAGTGSMTVAPDGGSATSPAPPAPSLSLDSQTGIQTVSYTVPAGLAAPSTVTLDVVAHPGNRLGTFTADATIGPVIANGATRTFTSSPVTVTDSSEAGNDTYDTAAIIAPDQLYVRHLNTPGDTDYYRVSASGVGAITRISLSHLAVDADLVVYEEDPSQFNFRAAVAKLRQQSKPVEMADPTGKTVGEPLEPAELQDISIEPGKVVADISAKRGTANEFVELINDNPDVDYVIAVHGYNNASSPDPYVVRVQQITPPGAVPCGPGDIQLPALPGGYTTSAGVSSIPVGTQTIILANRERLTREFGTTSANAVLADLTTFAARPDVNGAVVLVDGSADVRGAYANWDASPCGLGRPNLVEREINDYVDAILAASTPAARAGLQNLVVIGSDEQVPMARLIDNTKLSNELEYGAELRRPGANPGDAPISTPQSVAMASKSLLSDDPYASLAPRLFGSDVIYPPELSIGRLVETPAEISGVLSQFASVSGRLEPDSALITGYDFLSDGAEGVRDALAGAVPAAAGRDGSLINDTWTAGQLTAKLISPADAPDIGSINAHFDHHRLLPAEGDTTPTAPLFTTADVAAQPGKLAGRVLFSMGCHSGTGAPDAYLGSSGGDALDWPQVFAQERAVWVANSGFGYGDTAVVAYSERLMTLFAVRLGNGERAGEAMRLAKQDYLGGGIANSYDAKALTQIIYYGLPMYRVGSGTPTPPVPTFVTTTPDPSAGGLASYTVNATPDLRLSAPQPDSTRYIYAFDGTEPVAGLQNKTQVVDGRPIQPRVDIDVTAAGVEARGAVVSALEMTTQPLTVTVARPVVDKTANEPPIAASEMVYPSAFQNVTTFEDATGFRNNLVLIPGQWLPDADPATKPNVGTQRSFTSLTSTVYYAAPGDPDDIQPVISSTEGTASGGGVTFRAGVDDRTATGTGTVARVTVLYLDGSTWRSTELTQTSPGQFTGGGPATQPSVDYLVQAVDASGNVAVSSNKARLFPSGAAPAPGPGINGAPTVTAPASAGGSVLTNVVFSGSFVDADNSTTWTGTVNNGAGDTRTIAITGNGFVATMPPYASSGAYTATVSVCDGEGACGTATVPVTVSGSGVAPTADCTVLSFGRAITWWGTQSSEAGPTPIPVGPDNRFSPAPDDRGQPATIDPGASRDLFATESPPDQRFNWFLGGTAVEAMSARGCGS